MKNMNARADMYTIQLMVIQTMAWLPVRLSKTFQNPGSAPCAVLPRAFFEELD
jgi:hypothetical protein